MQHLRNTLQFPFGNQSEIISGTKFNIPPNIYSATAVAAADPTKNLEAPEAGLLL